MTHEEHQENIRRVVQLQHKPENMDQDHVTICGFFTTQEEFDRHIANLEG